MSTKGQEPLHFGLLLLFAGDVQVEMGSVGLVQQEGWAFAISGDESTGVVALTGYVAKGAAPEGCCPADIGDLNTTEPICVMA